MQIFTKSDAEISRNTNTDNYDNRIMQTRIMSNNDVSTTLLTTEHNKKSFINEQKNRMKITHIIMKQEWFKTSKTQQLTLNSLLWKRLYNTQIRKTRRVLFLSIKKILQEEKNKMSNLKHEKIKNDTSSKQTSQRIWKQAEISKDRMRKNERKDESYIILMRKKSHLWFRISSMTTCIDENFRKASRIRKVKKRLNSNIVIKCIKNTHKSTKIN